MYVIDITLGHGGLFNWLIEAAGTVRIRRRFAGGQVYVNVYSKDKLDQLHDFVGESEWVPLANNVEKLHYGAEKEGLGQFLKEVLQMDLASAQGASQLAAIFVKANAWEDNGRRRGMAFRRKQSEWQAALMAYYSTRLQQQTGIAAGYSDEEGEAEAEQLYFDLDSAFDVNQHPSPSSNA